MLVHTSNVLEMFTVIFCWFTLSEKASVSDISTSYDDIRHGRPITTDKNFEARTKVLLDNRGITIREVAEDVGISIG